MLADNWEDNIEIVEEKEEIGRIFFEYRKNDKYTHQLW